MFSIVKKTRKSVRSYQEVDGNLLELFDQGNFDCIAHGTNCFASMSGGIALQIANKWPIVQKKDAEFHAEFDVSPSHMLGLILPVGIDNKNVVNLYCQYRPGRPTTYDYQALTQCLINLNNMCKLIKKTRVGFPMIGSGIAGGDWNIIQQIIKDTMTDCQVTVVIFR